MDCCEATEPDKTQDTCLICQTDYNLQEKNENLSKIIDCNHIYHTECIAEWFKYNESCPICRRQLGKSVQPNLLQFLLLFLSLQNQQPRQENDGILYTYESQSLASSAFVCVFLSILLQRYTTAAEYNEVKHQILEIKSLLLVENETLPSTVNISSRTAIVREIKHRQVLMRCQLLQWLWTTSDPHHLQEPPEVPNGRALYQHPYLRAWRRKTEMAMDALM